MRDNAFVVWAFFADDVRELVEVHRRKMTAQLNRGLHCLRLLLNRLGKLFACVHVLGIDDVVKKCDHLADISVNNAVPFYLIAASNGLQDIKDLAFRYIVENFSKVS